MLYSCFDPARARYRVYADQRQQQVNSDLPVPSLPGDTGRIGVPAIDAARPFPRGARFVAESWQPRGIIVRCPGLGLGATDSPLYETWIKYGPLALAGGTAMLIWWIYKT